MRVIVHGATGRMGSIICRMVEEGVKGAELAAAVSFDRPEGSPVFKHIDEYTGEADVVIDFSNHVSTAELLAYCKAKKLPVVICTTGQAPEELEMIRQASEEIAIFRSANMSLGIAVLSELAKKAASFFPDADIEIVEKHHNQKLDVPSGTALALADSIRTVRPEAEYNIGRHEYGKRTKNEIGIHSLRMGTEVGTHEIIISSGNETITLTHEAESRTLFADGAMTAAAFLAGKPAGMYSMKDIIAD